MENSQANSFPVDNQLKTPLYTPSKKPLMIILSLVIFILFFLPVIIYLISQNKKPEISSSPAPISINVPTQEAVKVTITKFNKPSEPAQKTLKLSYLRDNNIWLVKADGTSLAQITRDGNSSNIIYFNPIFVNDAKLAFSRCTDSGSKCFLYEKNINSNEDKILFEHPDRISLFNIDSQEKEIIYIQSTFEGKSSLNIFKNKEHKKILEFEPALGRGGSISDEASVNFSPDEKHILVINTMTQPNEKNDLTTLWVIDYEGNIIEKISDKNVFSAVWDGNDKYLFISGGNLYQKFIKGPQNFISVISGYHLSFNPTNRELLYWLVSNDNSTQVKSMSITTKTESVIASGLSSPKWVNSNEFTAIKTVPDNNSMVGFSSSGLVLVNKLTKQEKVIDSHSSIGAVSVEPL